MKGFRDFLSQGNVVQLAVAFVIGAAFGAVVTALVVDVINPIIAIPFGLSARCTVSDGVTICV